MVPAAVAKRTRIVLVASDRLGLARPALLISLRDYLDVFA